MRKQGVVILIAILSHLTSSSQVNSQNPLETWDVFEITLVSKAEIPNPYLEITPEKGPFITARFNGIEGRASGHTITVPGFWDGERTWKIRFAPPAGGTWRDEHFHPIKVLQAKKESLNRVKRRKRRKKKIRWEGDL